MKPIFIALLATLFVIGANPVQAKYELADHQLEQITAGVAVTSRVSGNKTVTFEFQKDLGKAGSVSGSGSSSTDVQAIPGATGSISLVNSTATQNGLVNVIAVNSIITALLNLNVNINSNIENVQQN
ncbi:MAG: hypothetical protein AAGU11_19875, partial [Syntrophobacteraceae bacterium]